MAPSRFGIATPWLGADFVQPITAEVFREVGAAKDWLMACLALEEAYDVLILNYLGFERAMMSAAVQGVVVRARSRAELDDLRREVDRHLVNLLAAGQMFADHIDRRVKRSFGRRSAELQAVNGALEARRTQLLGFRVTEHLRDAVLHRALPITAWTQGGTWVDIETPNAKRQHTYSVAFNPQLLADDYKVERWIIAALQTRTNSNGRVEWVPIIREYVEALSLVQDDVRGIFAPSEVAAADLLTRLASEYRGHYGGGTSPYSISAVEFDERGGWVTEIPLEFDFAERVQGLRQRNRPMVNLHKLEIKA